jgi:hypothetical protein
MQTAQLIQIVGALLNIPNWLGSVLLVISAYVDHQWGFLMLEGAWVVVTGYAITARISGWQSRPTSH